MKVNYKMKSLSKNLLEKRMNYPKQKLYMEKEYLYKIVKEICNHKRISHK